MRKFIFALALMLMFGCQSDDDTNFSNFNSTIKVDGISYTPNLLRVTEGTSSNSSEKSMVFNMNNTDSGESLLVRIHYPINSTTAPNGEYDFGIGEIGTTLFADGGYGNSSEYFSLAGYTVVVTSNGNSNYKLNFQNVEAVNIQTNEVIIISGYCEGNFDEY